MTVDLRLRTRTPRPAGGRHRPRRGRLSALVGVALALAAPAAANAATGSITGTVRDAAGAPITDRSVCVSASSVGFGVGGGGTQAAADGTYELGALTPGSYRVTFSQCTGLGADELATQYYDGAGRARDARPVVVTGDGATAGIDARMQPGTTISGRVYGGAGNDTPLKTACVSAYEPPVDGATFPTLAAYTQTDADGTYRLARLTSGVAYRLQFSECGLGSTYLAQWHADQSTFAAAADVTPTVATPVTGLDGHLRRAATISGTVRDAAGDVITSKDVCVSAQSSGGGFVNAGPARTDADGAYTIGGLQPGSYVVVFRTCDDSTRNDVAQYYGGVRDRNSATLVVLSAEGAKTGIDARLAAGTSISGTLYDGPGTDKPVAGMCINAMRAGFSSDFEDLSSGSVNSGADGRYVFRGLPPRDDGYTVQFSSCGIGNNFLLQHFGGDERYGSGTVLKPTVAAPVTGADGHLVRAGSISGEVRDQAGETITSGVCVTASRVDGDPDATSSTGFGSLFNGRYVVGGLVPGRYRVTASSCGTADHLSTTSDEDIVVGAGEAVTAKAMTMRAGTSISGTIYAGPGTGRPLGGICARAFDAAKGPYDGATGPQMTSSSDGRYTIRALDPAKTYKVAFNDCFSQNGYARQYFDGTTDVDAATVLTPTVADPGTGADAHLTGSTVAFTSGPAEGAQTSDPFARFAFVSDGSYFSFECSIDGAPFTSCSSPQSTGELPDGPHTFAVREHGSTAAATTRRWTVRRSSPNSTAQGTVPKGGTFSTDPEAAPSSAQPVIAAVTLPAAGQVTVTKEPATQPSTNGYQVFGRQLDITAQAAGGTAITGTAAAPIALTFSIDDGELPAGYDLGRLSVLRNGTLVADCTGPAGTATPDPCVSSRRVTGDGDVDMTVLTTHLSRWNLVQTTDGTPGDDGGTGGGDQPGGGTPGGGSGGDAGAGSGTGAGAGTDAGSGGPAGGGAADGGSGGGASTGGAATGGGPGGSTGGAITTPKPAAPALKLGRIPAQRIAAVLGKGLRLPLTCSTTCKVRAVVTVDGATARRLRLAKRSTATVVGNGTVSAGKAPRTLVARFSAKARKALRRQRTVRFTVALTVSAGDAKPRTTKKVVTVRR